jgi:hypothetical protein
VIEVSDRRLPIPGEKLQRWYMEDRAARYLEKDDLLQINADFRVFADMIKR